MSSSVEESSRRVYAGRDFGHDAELASAERIISALAGGNQDGALQAAGEIRHQI
jgi:hypothetical protein